jgi:hypothetical protein
MRERLQDARELANEHLSEAKNKQKKYYDRSIKQRAFKEGDKVLILLPTDSNKLKMAWKGPYEVLDRVGQVDYGISIRGKRRVYHANMLKYYTSRAQEEEQVAAVVVDEDDQDEHVSYLSLSDAASRFEQLETWKDVVISKDLTQELKQEAETLIKQYADTFSDVPGRTTMYEHKIELIDQKPMKVKQLTLP